MPASIQVSRLQSGHARQACAAIASIKGANVPNASGIDTMRAFLARPENILIVASNSEAAVGFLLAYRLDRVDSDRAMVCLYEIVVAASHRRRGVGRAMIACLREICDELGAAKMWTITQRSNAAATGLFVSAGAAASGSADDLVFAWPEPGVNMRLQTGAAERVRQATTARRRSLAAAPSKARRLQDSAYLDLSTAIQQYREAGALVELIAALKARGQIERDRGRPEAALPDYEEALEICRQLGDALVLAHTARHVGDVQMERGKPDRARAGYEEAVSIYRRHPDTSTLDLANALRPLAILEDAEGNRAIGRELWSEARALYTTAGIDEGVAECDGRLAPPRTDP